MAPHRETLFSVFPPSYSPPFVSGPWLTSCVASRTSQLQGHRHVCRARWGGPRALLRTKGAYLDCAFKENAFVFVVSRPHPLYDPLKYEWPYPGTAAVWNCTCESMRTSLTWFSTPTELQIRCRLLMSTVRGEGPSGNQKSQVSDKSQR